MKRLSRIFRIIIPTIIMVAICVVLSLPIYALETTVCDGNIKISDTLGNISGTSTVTVKATGPKKGTQTNEITITNVTDKTANISFSYSKSNGYSGGSSTCVVDGTTSNSGTFLKNIGAGESVTIVLTAKGGSWGANTATLTLSNFSYTVLKDAYDVTINCLGKGTAKIDGATVTSGTAYGVSPMTGATLVATPNSGATFLGWIDTNNRVLSTSASYPVNPTSDMTVQAVFADASSRAWFWVDSNAYLCNDLNVATDKGTKIVLAATGILPAGNYTIPSGDTLLIPYDSAHTVVKDDPIYVSSTSAPTVFRELTMESGAHITVSGALSISGAHSHNQGYNGCPTGAVGLITMQQNSSITVNNEAYLYAWGYIAGSGSVTIKGGGTVYEDFQIKDWRGGSAMSSIIGNGQRVFPLTQYYVQNVEVPMTLEAGANEYVCMSVAASVPLVGEVKLPVEVNFIGAEGMFRLSEGSIIKDYVESEDRLQITIDGKLTMSRLLIPIKYLVINYTMDSEAYVLPIASHLDVIVNSGTVTISQDMALLPGSQLTIHEGANVTLEENVKLFVYDTDQWNGKGYVYPSVDRRPLSYVSSGAPKARAALSDARIVIDGTLDAGLGFVYTTEGGANIVGVEGGRFIVGANGTDTITYQAIQTGTDITYDEVTITPAKLQNGDGSYFAPSVAKAYQYNSVTGKWECAPDENEKHTHQYSLTGTKDATCGSAGTNTYTCSICGATNVEETSPATGNHNYTSEVTAPTCTEDGYTTHTCSGCGVTYTSDTVTKKGHTEVIDAAVAPTCTVDGKTEGKHCSVCGVVTVTQKVDKAKGHSYVANVAAPTCTAAGYTTYTCSTCGDNYKANEVAALGHKYSASVTTAPTCTEKGEKTYTCSACSVSYTEEVAANGHTEVIVPAVAPTCTATGLTEGKKCSACGTFTVAQTEVDALGHTEGGTVVENSVAADCENGGSYDNVTYCTVCGVETSRETITVEATGHDYEAVVTDPTCEDKGYTTYTCSCGDTYTGDEVDALGHTEVVDAAVAPTCTATGLTEGKHCSVCDEVLVAQETVDALGHDYDDGVETTAPGCETEGEKTFTCNTCGDTYTEKVDATGHSYGEWTQTKAPTCTEKGEDRRDCNVCDHYETLDVSANGHTPDEEGHHCTVCEKSLCEIHTPGEPQIENKTEATCTVDGSYDSVIYCNVCDDIISTTKQTISASGHTEAVDAAKAPTCTETGLTEGSHCDVCGEVLVAQTVVDALGHTPVVDAAVAATCTEKGKTEGKHCSVCHEVLVAQEEVAALGHTEAVDAAVAPTCTATGLTEGKHCSVCSEVLVAQEEVGALGHTEVVDAAVPATCTKTGLTEGSHCGVCGNTITAQTEVPALGHDYESTVTAPTCTVAGYTTYTCDCGDTYTADEVDALGHTAVVDAAKAPTCTATGLTEGSHCDVCGEVLVAQETVSSKGHSYKAVVTAPTCTVAGYTTYTCSTCGDNYKANEVAALGHTEVVDEAVEPNCTETGLTEGKHCSVCGTIIVAQEEIPATGHTAGSVGVENEVDATCTVDGSYDNVTYCTVCGAQTSRETATVSATGHDYDSVVTAPTCIDAGYTTYTCSKCDDTYTADEVDALGHTAGNVVVENEVSATCTVDGSYDNVTYCTVCGVQTSRETVTVPATGHDYNAVVTAPTCMDAGYTTYTCSKCGDTYTADEVAALGHTAGNVVVENEVSATCTVDGSYDNVTYCTVCGVQTSRETVTVSATGHTEVIDKAVASTCTATGLTQGKHCSVCHEVLVAQEETPSLGHTEVVDAAEAATCTKTGLTEGKHCSVCNAVLVAQEKVVALGHTAGEITVENRVAASCTTDGSYDNVTYCTVCGVETNRETITVDALGHTDGKTVVENEDAADCENAGSYDNVTYCTVCGVETSRETITVDALGHTGGETVVENEDAADCENAGSYDNVVYCSVCDEELSRETITVDALGHTEGDPVVENATAATCGAAGSYEEVVYCSACGEELSRENKTVDALPHTEVVDAAVAPTCTATGLTAGKHCSVCNKVIVAQEEVAALGHTEETIAAVAPTCTATGLTAGKHCSVCSEILTAQETVDALGHTEETIAAVAPTCVKNGLTAGEKCSVCGEILTAQDVVPALGHTDGAVVVENNVAPTCTATGSYDNVTYCTVCDVQTSREKVTVDATGHTDGAVVVENNVDATCTADGSYDNATYCTVCGAQTSRETVTVSATGHTEEVISGYVATCTETGLTDGAKCSTCGETLIAQEEIPATGHSDGNVVVENEVDATCTADGSYDNATYCTVCGAQTSRETITVPATGHTDGAVVVENNVDATCTADGSYDNVVYCSVCDEELSRETVTIGALGHTEVIDAAVAATCTETGLTEGKHCSVCNEVLVAQETVDALGHTEVTDEAVAPTCTATGLTEGVHCDVCGEVITQQTVVDALGHTEVTDDAVDPTCTATGLTEGAHCEVCGETLTAQEVVPALGHTEVTDEAVAPTCTATGLTEGKHCSVCDAVIVAQVTVDALGHTEVIDTAVDATCTETGLTEGKHCSVCGEVLVAQEVVDALGHTEVIDTAVAATCIATGLTEGKHCSVCNEVLIAQEVVPAKGHTEVVDAAVDATCTETGLTEGKHCDVCGEVIEAQVTVAATGHSFGEWEVTTPPTENTQGEKRRDCANCDAYETTPVAELSHDHSRWDPEILEAVAPTCTTTGLTAGVKCSGCGEILDAQEVVPVIAHTEVIDVAVAPTCTETGLTEGKHCSGCNAVLVAQNTVAALGHTEVIDAAVAPGCENTGLTEGKHCSVCDAVLVAQETVDALGHTASDAINENIINATCLKAGSHDSVVYCSVCDEELDRVKVDDPALGHTEAQAVMENRVESTCTTKGSYDSVVYCTDCHEEISRTTTTIRVKGHTIVTDKAVDVTCTTFGKTEGKHCTVCKEILVAQEIIPATGHTYDNDEDHECNNCGYIRDLMCQHTETVAGCDEMYRWEECSDCQAKINIVDRTYTIKVIDYWGKETLIEGATYDSYLGLTYATSNVLELQHEGWTVDGKTVHPYEVWKTFNITKDTEVLTVTEATKAIKVKPGAIMMSVNYDQANSEKTMTVDLFIYVDSLNDKYKPTVTFGGAEKELVEIDSSIMMWFVSIDLSAAQITQGGTNVQIMVDYPGVSENGDAPDKVIDSVLIAYEKALQDYLKENGGDHAGEAQDQAINAVLDYGKTVQYVFGNLTNDDDVVYDDEEIADYAAKAEGVIINNAPNKSDDEIIFNWDNADVNFQSEYSIRYKFTLADADGLTPVSAQLIVRDGSDAEPIRYTFAYDRNGELNFGPGVDDEGNSFYYVKYPVPASELTKDGTTVQLVITLVDSEGKTKEAVSSEMNYGVYAYLTRQLWLHTKGKETFTDAQGNDKTEEYVNMLVSLIKLGESVNRIEAMKPDQQ